MACFPVSPRYAKMLSLGHQQGLLPYVVAVVAALSVQEVFVEFHKSSEDKSEFQEKLKYMTQIKRMWAGWPFSPAGRFDGLAESSRCL